MREQPKSTPSNTLGSAADSPEDNLPLGLHVQTAHFAQFNKESTRESSQCAHRHHGGHVLDTTRNSQGSALALALCTFQELLNKPRTLWNTSDSHMQPRCAYSHTSSLASTSVHTLALGEKPLFIGSLAKYNLPVQAIGQIDSTVTRFQNNHPVQC